MYALRGLKRIICALLVLVLLAAAALTYTRAAYSSIPLSILVMALLAPTRRIRNALLSGLSLLPVIMVLLPALRHVPIITRIGSQDLSTPHGHTYIRVVVFRNFDA